MLTRVMHQQQHRVYNEKGQEIFSSPDHDTAWEWYRKNAVATRIVYADGTTVHGYVRRVKPGPCTIEQVINGYPENKQEEGVVTSCDYSLQGGPEEGDWSL